MRSGAKLELCTRAKKRTSSAIRQCLWPRREVVAPLSVRGPKPRDPTRWEGFRLGFFWRSVWVKDLVFEASPLT
jgi:hypothetical protein